MGGPKVEVVADLEVELRPLADLTKRYGVVLGVAIGRVGVRQVRQGRGELVPLGLHAGELRLALLEGAAELPHLDDRLIRVLALALQLCDLLRDSIAARAALLQLGEKLPAPPVQLQKLVEGVGGPAAAQSGARRLGVLADAPEVEHRPILNDLLGFLPGVLRDEVRDLAGLAAGDDVRGHDPARESAVADRE